MTVIRILPGLLILLVAAAALGAGCTAPHTPPADRITPAGTAVQEIPTGEAGPFTEEGIVTEDRVIARFIPRDDEPTAYRVSYEVLTDGTTQEHVEGRVYEDVSPDNPITIAVLRRPDESVTFDVVIRDADGTVVWESRGTYGPLTISELG